MRLNELKVHYRGGVGGVRVVFDPPVNDREFQLLMHAVDVGPEAFVAELKALGPGRVVDAEEFWLSDCVARAA